MRKIHRLTAINEVSKTAICSSCGLADIRKTREGGNWRCYARPKEKIKTLNLVGLTLEDYNNHFRKIEEKCEICGDKVDYDLYVDHCHSTLQFRGLLCRLCNAGLGMFKDNKENLLKAAKYLGSQ